MDLEQLFQSFKQETKATLVMLDFQYKHDGVCIKSKELILFLKKRHTLVFSNEDLLFQKCCQ